jgi:hypothetical protein
MGIPQKLYRYRALADDKMLERELDTLRNSYLYSPPFEAMNDPMEAFYETGGPGDRIIDAMLKPAGKGTRELYKILDDMIAKFALVSFSSAPDDLPLWAYYAGNFAGICLEFDTEDLTLSDFQGEKLKQVIYARDALPPLSMADLAPERTEEAVLARITRKRIEWAHEKEWRYVTGSVGPKHYVDDALRRVYLGPKIKPEHAEAILDILKNRPTEVLQGEIAGFELRFRTIKEATPLAKCERVGSGKFVKSDLLLVEGELREFLDVPFERLVAECARIAAHPNLEEITDVYLSGVEKDSLFLWAKYRLRNGREVWHKTYFDRHLQKVTTPG